MQEIVFEQFQKTGEDLFRLGLTSSHGGNMSIRHQGKLLITTHFSMLGRLEPGDLVDIPLREQADHITSDVSKDVGLHQLIYKFTAAGAIIHAHPAHAVVLSLDRDVITPLDLEGAVLLREIPVIAQEVLSEQAPQLLQTHVSVVARAHGCYVVGRTLTETLAYTSALGFSCRVTWLSRAAGADPQGA